ncbi:type II toxin-antitoxin system VapC family toxin [Marinactinospora thermotolerans]|uniref:type II toxin-antitoxin system VapC family toxin n=1 Tax=Marinactinospora thermotolerans TaxID=531310 RepID=UPI003D8FF410
MIVADTGFLIALLSEGDADHRACVELFERQTEQVRVPASVVAGVSHALERLGAPQAEAAFFDELNDRSRFVVVEHTRADYARMADLVGRHPNSGFGTAEAGAVAVAERLGGPQIATVTPGRYGGVRPEGVDYLLFAPPDQSDALGPLRPRDPVPEDTEVATRGDSAVLDTGVLVSLVTGDRHTEASERWLARSREELLVPDLIVGEAAFQIRRLGAEGNRAEASFLRTLAEAPDVRVVNARPKDYGRMAQIIREHADIKVGGCDASVLVAAERHRATSIATVDSRDFQRLADRAGASWRLPLQADQAGRKAAAKDFPAGPGKALARGAGKKSRAGSGRANPFRPAARLPDTAAGREGPRRRGP